MEEDDFQQRADACLEKVASWLEAFDPDELDYSSADGVLTLEFAGGARFVLNRQTAAGQMWLAAGARAWHFGWDAARAGWSDERDGADLYERLRAAVADELGRPVEP